MKKYCFITNDVETTSLWNHCLSDRTGEKVMKEGMPILLKAYEKYNVKATFYFTGYIAQKFPDIVKMILPYEHEVACHGFTHDSTKAFDVLSLKKQIESLKKAKDILENICNESVISFRAPALRVNKQTPRALIETGFSIDSSVAPQRFDILFSFGAKNKLSWITASRAPYFVDQNNLARKGDSRLLEIPASSFILPYAGTLMRLSPSVLRLIRFILLVESKITGRPIVFIIHPNEFIEEETILKTVPRRAKYYITYLLGDKLRYYLKLKNLGLKAEPLLYSQLQYFERNNFNFITTKAYYEILST